MTLTTQAMPETGTWTIDPAHSVIGFSVKHLMAAKVRGSFKTVSGSIEVGPNAEASSVEVTIDAASIDTGAADRDAHLRSADFLTVDEYPTLTFSSTSVSESADGTYSLNGNLTIKGVSKPVTLDMVYAGTIDDPWGNGKAIFSATTTIQREAWGLTWNAPLEAGGWLVGKEVTIEIEVQATRG